MPLFNRVLNLRIGSAGSTEGLEVTKLRVIFNAKKSIASTTNQCVVTIYNLNENQRSQVRALHSLFILEAGYDQESGLQFLFSGDITKVSHVYQSPDWITKIQFNDGANALQNSTVNTSYAAGTPVKSVMNGVLKTFGVPTEVINPETLPDTQYANGFSDTGSAKKSLDTITAKLGAEWSIQNGKLIVRKKGSVDNTTGYELTPSTGLIGVPSLVEDSQNAAGTQTTSVGKSQWEIKTLLLPTIIPGNRIKIAHVKNFKDGLFRVEEVEHVGDTHGLDWNTTLKVVAV